MGMKKAAARVAAVMAATALVMSVVAVSQSTAVASNAFEDDNGSIHEGAIDAIAELGITKGCAPGSFCPDDPVTREQMATFLVRAFRLRATSDSGFSDIASSPHAADIERLAAAGVTNGCRPGAYCPTRFVTRAEIATFLARAMGLSPISYRNTFVDDDGLFAEPNIEAIAAEGVTAGCGPENYCPVSPVTRAETASLLARALRLPIASTTNSTSVASPSTTLATTSTSTTSTTPSTSTTSTSTTTSTTLPPPPAAVGPVVIPPGAVRIAPGQSIQAAVDSHSEGTAFVLASGVHSAQKVTPKNGNGFYGESGAVLDGRNSVEYAFVGSAGNVTIAGLVIQNYANPPQKAAIQAWGSGWVIQSNEVRYNAGAGIWVGTAAQVVGNTIHHNRQIGLLANGAADALVANNEIAHNNPDNTFDYGWEAGGTKFINTSNLVVRGNNVHDNHGPGLWTDSNNRGTVYEQNTVDNNHGPGILHEISYSAIIRNNTVRGNAFPFYVGGILVSESTGVEVYGNTVSGNDGGIIGIQANRGGFLLGDLWVHDNAISFTAGWNGVVDHTGTAAFSRNVRYDRNAYSTTVASPFKWRGSSLNWSGWRAAGHDLSGSIS